MRRYFTRLVQMGILSSGLFSVLAAWAQVPSSSGSAKAAAPTGPRAPSSLGAASNVSDSNQALEVRGQSRNLSMMLVLKNRKSNIDFVKPREHYSEEIRNTGF